MAPSSKKRGRSMFDSVKLLESQDVSAAKKRHVSTKRDLARSKAATGQTKVYGSLMECRILLQRSIQTVHAETSESNSDGDDENEEAVEKCNQLLAKLLEARERLVPSVTDDDDETDYEELTANSDSSQLEKKLQNQYDICQTEWKQTLNRRHKDVRLHAGLTAKAQFRVMDSSFWEQVDATVQHEQLRVGGNNNTDDSKNVFDDTKVYQHLLKGTFATCFWTILYILRQLCCAALVPLLLFLFLCPVCDDIKCSRITPRQCRIKLLFRRPLQRSFLCVPVPLFLVFVFGP
jgi:hypothetical protein